MADTPEMQILPSRRERFELAAKAELERFEQLERKLRHAEKLERAVALGLPMEAVSAVEARR